MNKVLLILLFFLVVFVSLFSLNCSSSVEKTDKLSNRYYKTETLIQDMYAIQKGTSVFCIISDIAIGSGFFINENGLALTCAHVFKNNLNPEAMFYDGTKRKINIVDIDKSLDLALIKVDGNGYETLPLGILEEIKPGVNVIAIGTPSETNLVVNSIINGNISGIVGQNIIFNALINHGLSGGPLLGENGKVYGIVTGKNDETTGISLAVSCDVAIELFKLKKKQVNSSDTLIPISFFTIKHNGTLNIKVLKNGQPVKFDEYFISCAKRDNNVRFQPSTNLTVPIIDANYLTINVHLYEDGDRWLLDRYELRGIQMPNYKMEINGQTIPDTCVVESESVFGKHANYVVGLKRE